VGGGVSPGGVSPGGFGSVRTGGTVVVGGGATVTDGTVLIGVVTGGVVTIGVDTVGIVTAGRPGGVLVVAAGADAEMNRTATAGAARTSARLTTGKRRGRRMVAGCLNQLQPWMVARSEEQEDWELHVETCRIALWRGYLTSSFVARVTEGPERGAVIETSSSFRWRGSKPRDLEEARLAHHELVSLLKNAGWSPNGEGAEWYETELARPTLVPPLEPDVAPSEPEPEPAPQAAVVVAPPVEQEPLEHEQEPVPVREAPASPVADQLRPARRDRWRAVALVGLLVAIVFLVVVVTHS
jgi:hypothetical protein